MWVSGALIVLSTGNSAIRAARSVPRGGVLRIDLAEVSPEGERDH